MNFCSKYVPTALPSVTPKSAGSKCLDSSAAKLFASAHNCRSVSDLDLSAIVNSLDVEWLRMGTHYSPSIVASGFDEISYTTRFMPVTSLIVGVEIRASSSSGRWLQSAVMKSSVATQRKATALSQV